MNARSPLFKVLKAAGIGVAILLLVGFVLLPALAVGAFVARPIGLVLVVVFALAVIFSARFRTWLGLEKPEPIPLEGVNLPSNVSIHASHGWASRVARNRVVAGADHLIQNALGPVDQIETPAPGTSIAGASSIRTCSVSK